MSDHLAALTALIEGDRALDALSPRDLQVLALINKEREPLNQTRAAEALTISQPHMNRILKKLIARGFVVSTRDPKDNRNTFLSVTGEGRKIDTRVRKHFNTAKIQERTPAL